MMFRIGQKVVCIQLSGDDRDKRIQKGDVVTIRDLMVCNVEKRLVLRFKEFVLPIACPIQGEYGWDARFFRPAVEKSTDAGMAILKGILERETVRDPVQATS